MGSRASVALWVSRWRQCSSWRNGTNQKVSTGSTVASDFVRLRDRERHRGREDRLFDEPADASHDSANLFSIAVTVGNILATDIDGRMIEAEAHRLLDRHRLAGEWFDVSADVAFEAVGQAARNMGMPVITTDSEKLAQAVIDGKTSVNDLQKPLGKPLDIGFASEMVFYAIGVLMVVFGSMGYFNSKTDESFVIYFIIGLILAFPFFTGGLIVRIFRKGGR